MEALTKLSCEEFLEKLASGNPTPGGGGGAAVAGALAAALSSMVANITVGKEKFAEQEQEVQELLQSAETLRQRLLKLVDADAAVFDSFMACYKLPKNTDEEKQTRTQAIRNAAKQAAEVPFSAAQACLEVLRVAVRIVEIGNPNVITDGTISALLARAAMRSELYNVRINLGLTKDDSYNAELLAKLDAMEKEALALENKALQTTDAAID